MTADQPPRPDPIGPDPDAVPETLRDLDQWIAWRYEWDAGRDEWTKIPVDVNTGRRAKSTDPDTWANFDAAVAYHDRSGTDTDGLGFVFAEDGTVAGIDLDDCRDPETGDLDPWAADLTDDVPTYTEVSPSGTGLHLIGLGFVPDGGHRGDVPDTPGHIEMYDSGRYFTVTGDRVDGTPAIEQVGKSTATDHALDATRYALMGEVSDGGSISSTTARLNSGVSGGGTDEEPTGVNLDEIARRTARRRQKSWKW